MSKSKIDDQSKTSAKRKRSNNNLHRNIPSSIINLDVKHSKPQSNQPKSQQNPVPINKNKSHSERTSSKNNLIRNVNSSSTSLVACRSMSNSCRNNRAIRSHKPSSKSTLKSIYSPRSRIDQPQKHNYRRSFPKPNNDSLKRFLERNKTFYRNLTSEASLTNLDDDEHLIPDKLINNEEILVEFHQDSINKMTKNLIDPYQYLLPSKRPNEHFLNRQINFNKLLLYMVKFMDDYFNLKNGTDPFSEYRQKLMEKLSLILAYLIPLICKQAIDDVFKQENLIIFTEPDCLIFGDIHGNLNDVHFIYKQFITMKKYQNYKFIFLGDYVDRGPFGVEVVIFLILLKLIEPKRIIILRGNHETEKVNEKYGFKDLIDLNYGNIGKKDKVISRFIYRTLNDLFMHLPLACIVQFRNKKSIFCCHGGIPNEQLNQHNRPWTIDELQQLTCIYKPHDLIPRKRCPPEQSALSELLWNDPIRSSLGKSLSSVGKSVGIYFLKNCKRGGFCSIFTEEAIDRFFHLNNLRLLIRGHQFRCTRNKGFHYHFSNQQVLTIFSSSNYSGIENNTTSYVDVTENNCQPFVLRTSEETLPYQYFNMNRSTFLVSIQ